MKQFLKPDLKRGVLFIIFALTSYFVVKRGPETSNWIGFPIFHTLDGCTGESACFHNYIFWNNLVIDIIVWYFLACFIVWLYDKFKKKSPPNRF